MQTRTSNRSTQRKPKKTDDSRQRTNVPGQNPKADDAPDKDVYHDENRRNPYEPEKPQYPES